MQKLCQNHSLSVYSFHPSAAWRQSKLNPKHRNLVPSQAKPLLMSPRQRVIRICSAVLLERNARSTRLVVFISRLFVPAFLHSLSVHGLVVSTIKTLSPSDTLILRPPYLGVSLPLYPSRAHIQQCHQFPSKLHRKQQNGTIPSRMTTIQRC